ncbi:T9SS type A sorting domain-containing protein [Phaeodactylibacter sp.]|uniref:T9SS type A sorting domain-containing protein n=1 Tax=Phaeodactylibacter sp. TaxID=1940289 RepID=UPI0025D98A2E|nr:T9SS type A sorting domain-containing protein [Phaeodactylibacter sp.]MCI4647460.1 T9SS type A sorting domain-containing protein [Phaeodactylibacter sp.]MCI5094638.1 T9SS type A sorting domain-containing protein [Phaeodactylibacter sp.]
MKNFNITFFITALLCMLVSMTYAQTIIPVSPGLGTLNEAIDSYIADNGATSMDVIFELEDGGFYILTSTIENEDPLRIEAEADAAVRPVIRPNVPEGGDPFRAFRARNDITLRGLFITNKDAIGGADSQILRVSEDGARVVIDNCHFDFAPQSAIRLDNTDNKLYITNSIISNIVNLSNPGNGRGIDDRGNDIDTVWVENTTFYNLSARMLRDDGGVVNYAKFNHVTGVNLGDRTVDLGEFVEAEITNNLFVNSGFLGFNEPGASSLQVDSSDLVQSALISNINFYVDPALQTLYDQLNVDAEPGDSVYVRNGLNSDATDIATSGGTLETITDLAVTFNNGPATPLDYVETFYQDPDNALPLDDGNGGVDPDNAGQLPFDFGYSTDSDLFDAGNDGLPLGDLNWHDLTSSTFDPAIAKEVQLTVFPNPVQERMTFQFELPEAQPVRLVIFNQLGQPAAVVLDNQLGAGEHQLQYNAEFLPTGTYFYRLELGDRFASGRFIRALK